MHLLVKLIQPIILFIILITNIYCDSISSSRKKELKVDQNIPPENETIINKTNVAINGTNVLESTTKLLQENKSNDNLATKPNFSDLNKNDIPGIFEAGFIICIVIGLIAIILIACKAYNMRRSRAERRYGVRGDRSAQELIPLPIAAIEDDDSDIEDHTLFDRNRIT